jgi:hypothetical protein
MPWLKDSPYGERDGRAESEEMKKPWAVPKLHPSHPEPPKGHGIQDKTKPPKSGLAFWADFC